MATGSFPVGQPVTIPGRIANRKLRPMTPRRLTRCYFSIPAHNERMVARAASSYADAVLLDLENAGPVEKQCAALDSAIKAITKFDWGRKVLSLRLNDVGTALIDHQLDQLSGLERLDSLLLRKAEKVEAVVRIGDRLSGKKGLRPTPVELDLSIETALGVVNVDTLASCHPIVASLHFGAANFAASIGALSDKIDILPSGYQRRPFNAMRRLDLFVYPMMKVLVAARAFGLRAVDGPYDAYHDDDGTRAAALMAATMGFDGKQVIHPSQIDATTSAFFPSADCIVRARRVMDAVCMAEREGHGAAFLDNQIIDAADIRMAERVMLFASSNATPIRP